VTTNKSMYRAVLLYGELRYIYRLPKHEASERPDAWLAWASRSRLKPFIKLTRTIRQHKHGVLAAIELGLSNGRLVALNSKVRLLSHRAYGFHSANALGFDVTDDQPATVNIIGHAFHGDWNYTIAPSVIQS
jgi:transposase